LHRGWVAELSGLGRQHYLDRRNLKTLHIKLHTGRQIISLCEQVDDPLGRPCGRPHTA
jgi:hypothetical protein